MSSEQSPTYSRMVLKAEELLKELPKTEVAVMQSHLDNVLEGLAEDMVKGGEYKELTRFLYDHRETPDFWLYLQTLCKALVLAGQPLREPLSDFVAEHLSPNAQLPKFKSTKRQSQNKKNQALAVIFLMEEFPTEKPTRNSVPQCAKHSVCDAVAEAWTKTRGSGGTYESIKNSFYMYKDFINEVRLSSPSAPALKFPSEPTDEAVYKQRLLDYLSKTD